MDRQSPVQEICFGVRPTETLRKYRVPRGIITVLKGSGCTTRDRVPITPTLLNAKAKSRRSHRPTRSGRFGRCFNYRFPIKRERRSRDFNYAPPAPVEIPMLTRWGNPTRFLVAVTDVTHKSG